MAVRLSALMAPFAWEMIETFAAVSLFGAS
jgi:hypothetical protein